MGTEYRELGKRQSNHYKVLDRSLGLQEAEAPGIPRWQGLKPSAPTTDHL